MVCPREQSVFGRDEAVALAGLCGLLAITTAWWALALWPVAEQPVWLARTRYVCFGVAESGLPDTAGWIGLIGGPLGMLAILLAGWWRGVRRLVRRARVSRGVAAALIVVASGAAVLVAGATLRIQQARALTFDPTAGNVQTLDAPRRLDAPAPKLSLRAHDGTVVTLAALRGRPVLVTFAYAHCQTVCPRVVRDVLRAQSLLHTDGIDAAVIVVTLDPWRDTPARLPHIAAAWALPANDAWLFGGGVNDVEAALDAWGVPRARNTATGEITHPSLVHVITAEGRIAYAATGNAQALANLVRGLWGKRHE